MNESDLSKSLATIPFELETGPTPTDASANPFRLVVDPDMRMKLRKALFELIENHDRELARYVSEGRLALDSYKEYAEIFAKSLRETMASREGVSYLLKECGFDVSDTEINLDPETRWRE